MIAAAIVMTVAGVGTTAMAVTAVTLIVAVAVSIWAWSVSKSVRPAGVVKTSAVKNAAAQVVVHSVAALSKHKAAVVSD